MTDFSFSAPALFHSYTGGVRGMIRGHRGEFGDTIGEEIGEEGEEENWKGFDVCFTSL